MGGRKEGEGEKERTKKEEKANEFWIDSISNGHDCLYKGKNIVIKWSIKMPGNFSVA